MTDLNKESEVDTLPEVAHLLEQCKHRDLTLIERAFVKGARYAWLEKAKAQAVPEGYVLMPKVPTEKMFQAYERYSVAPMSTLSKTGYKAMVEASESGAEG
ncbi:hypothetical protein ABTP92_03830 [Acinetobacter baumannii]